MAHAGLSGKVHDRGKTMGGEQRRRAGTIRQIELRETKARETRELRKPRLLEFRIVIGVEIVDADDRVPFAQAARNMKANESRRTGDEDRLGRGHERASLAPIAARMLAPPGLEVSIDHFLDEPRARDLVAPAEFLARLRGVADERLDLGRPEIARVDLDQHLAGRGVEAALADAAALPLDAPSHARERLVHELADGMTFPGCQHVLIRPGLLHDEPHAFDEVARMP